MIWKTARRTFTIEHPLVMAILNVTPDSFSDGGKYVSPDAALKRVEQMIAEGADIIDIGGESTRPDSARIGADEEISRVVPVIESVKSRLDVAVSIDTSKAEVAEAALKAGAEIINDVSGLRFDPRVGSVAARHGAGIVLMHLRGTFESMHRQEPVEDIFAEVREGLRWSIDRARDAGVEDARIALDIGLGFSKTFDQNLQLIGRLDKMCREFPDSPMLVGASRKSFIGKILGGIPPEKRVSGSLAAAIVAAWNGASIVRVHDVRQTIEALKVAMAIKSEASPGRATE